MSMSDADILNISMPNTYVKLLTQDFCDHQALVANVGIPATNLAKYTKDITVRQHLQCIANALAMRPDPDWHLRWGKRMAGNFHGPLTLAMLSAPNLGEGLDVFLNFIPSRIPYHQWNGFYVDDKYHCEVNQLIDLGPTRDALIEVPMIVMQEYVRIFQTGSLAGARVELSYTNPPHQRYYDRWFDCPVVLGCQRNALIIPRAWRQLINLDFNESAWLGALERCEATYPLLDDVRAVVTKYLNTAIESDQTKPLPTAEEMAKRFNVSARTLIRRLRDGKTSYRQLLDDVLKKKALEMIAAPDYPVHYIAARLGYSDPKSFRRAFKRWCGVPPGEYRKKLNRAP